MNKAQKNKPFLFDGKLFHIQNQKLQGSKLIFSMCISSFKEYVGTCSNDFNRLFGQDNIVRPPSIGTMIITTDNKWILGRRLETHDYQGSYTLVSGYMDPDKDVIDFKPDPLFAVKRELKEETGIEETCVSDITCVGLDGKDQPYLAFVTKLTILFKKFTKEAANVKEFKKMEEFNLIQKGIDNFLTSNYERITPHTIANILMYYQRYLRNDNNNTHGPNE